MIASEQELIAVLNQFNPWWSGIPISGLPSWRRVAFTELKRWIVSPPAPRAVLVSGARQTGKTTLLRQTVEEMIATGVDPQRILYATLDHPLLKLIGIVGVMDIWRKIIPESGDTEYILIDEIQYAKDWQTWLKHEVDFHKNRRIAVTGSALPLSVENVESGVGRWHTIKLPTLSFYEYLCIKDIALPSLPRVLSLTDLFGWREDQFLRTGQASIPLIAHFHEYLLHGGFPQTARMDNVQEAQRLLREDIVDKVLKRDMTAFFGVRRVLELERTFLYLCLHDGGILDVEQLCRGLELGKSTVLRFLEILESSHLIYKLSPFGYGKEVLRARHKVYLADAAIAGSVLLKGKGLLEDTVRLGAAVETAIFKHIFSRYYQKSIGFSYWRGKRGLEVDFIAQLEGGVIVPFEVKYSQGPIDSDSLKGLHALVHSRKIERGYLVTRSIADFEVRALASTVPFLLIPAHLAALWLSQTESESQ